MSTRAAPGPQLSTGRLRVDAARAIAKLREYQLVDRTAWILEAIRAAVASGATAITLSGDANDVWLAWEGEPWTAEELPRLFDELVSPEPLDERHHLRLLAAAVNSALGIDPAFVDLYSVSAEGTLRARYTPDVLVETADIEDSALRKVTAQPAEPPSNIAYSTGMVVHLRRRAALGMLTYLFWHREPPELATARAACRELAVPIVIGRDTYSRERHADLARIPFGGDLDGFVALCDPTMLPSEQLEAVLEVAERGVILARYTLPLAVCNGEAPRWPVPLRVFVDAKRMPTNASRSQVRREVPPISTTEQRTPALVDTLLEQLAKDLGEADPDPRKRHAALSLIASRISGPEWTSLAFTERLGSLGKAEVLRDATGKARTITHAWSGHVYTGAAPLEPELGPWVSGILWVPRSDPANAIVAGATLDARETKRRLKWAKQQRKSHRRFFAHAPRQANLTLARRPRVRISLGAKLAGGCVPASWFENLSGELAVTHDRGDGEVLLLFQGRPIERIVMPSPIGFEAIVDAVHLTPGEHYKSVSRDAYYAAVERALQGALISAAEVIAGRIDDGTIVVPGGITEGVPGPRDVEARTVRAAMGLARTLNLPRSALLSKAKAWPLIGGDWVDLHALANDRVIGTASSTSFARPRNRKIVVGNAQLLDKLLTNTRVVDYDKLGGIADPARVATELAAELAIEHGYALAISGPELRGAIAVTRTKSLVRLHHLGHPLDRCELKGALGGCIISVDSDDIVPDAGWKTAADTAGLHQSDFRDWEVALLRATLLTIAGERPPELIGSPARSLDNPLVEWAFGVLQAFHSPKEIDPSIDDALLERVRAANTVHVLGEHDLISMTELAKRFPTKLYYVDAMSAPVEGFAPMVASAQVAEVIGRLTGIAVADGRAELVRQRRLAERNARLAKHRKQPELPLAFPFDEPCVELVTDDDLALRGVIGVGRNRLELDIRIEGRPFVTLIRSDELPLHAVIDLDIEHADSAFAGLAEPVTSNLIARVKQSAPAVLARIAKERPVALADPGFTRTLLARWLETASMEMFPKLREVLCAAPAFMTIYKTRTSLDDATQPSQILRTSMWSGDWLAVEGNESPSAFEDGVLLVLGDDLALAAIIEKLHSGRVVEVGDEVSKLQARRRMARGLIPMPALPHVPRELKRKISELSPELAQRLGDGEIGLVGELPSVLIHDHGTLRQRLQIEAAPAVQLAIEAPELLDSTAVPSRSPDLAGTVADQLARLRDLSARSANVAGKQLANDARQLASRLLRQVIDSGVALPEPIRSGIRKGLLTKKIARSLVGAMPLFELTTGKPATFDELEAQIAQFGDAWVVTRPTDLQPLDDKRLVFLMAPDELSAAIGYYACIDAAGELDLDRQARRNQARTPVATLDLRGRDYLLAQGTLDGDGITQPRGVIALLMPHAVEQRGVVPHRGMVPFSLMSDFCRWPTIALVEDARFEPDRTWDRPKTNNEVWTDVSARISAASERLLLGLVPQQERAIAHVPIGPGVALGAEAMARRLQIRGAVWLAGPPRMPFTHLEVVDAYGRHSHVLPDTLGMYGRLFVHAPEGWDRVDTLDELMPRLYGLLVTQLLSRHTLTTKAPSDLIAAHAATALALGAIQPSQVGPMLFTSIRPEPLDASRLKRMFAEREPVSILSIAELEAELIDPDVPGVVEDGSELSQALIARLGSRGWRGRKLKRRTPPAPVVRLPAVEPERIEIPVPRFEVPAPKPESTPEVIHPIQNVVEAVRARLIDEVSPQFGARVVEATSPIIGFSRGLTFAGRDPRLHAIANALRANSPWAQLAIEALCAHAITVLDDAYSEVNQQTVRDVLGELLG